MVRVHVNGQTILKPSGKTTYEVTGKHYELCVMQSENGYYLGTYDDGGPLMRESLEYWTSRNAAQEALESAGKEDQKFTQYWPDYLSCDRYY